MQSRAPGLRGSRVAQYSIRRGLAFFIATGFILQTAGCGTLLYPERRGQAPGKYDTDVVLLDAAGLLIGIVPGVIAFAVDFTTGAIYLPRGQKSRTRDIFGSVEIERHPFRGQTLGAIEAALQTHAGVRVDLRAPTVRFTRPAEDRDLESQLRSWNRLAVVSRVSGEAPISGFAPH